MEKKLNKRKKTIVEKYFETVINYRFNELLK